LTKVRMINESFLAIDCLMHCLRKPAFVANQ